METVADIQSRGHALYGVCEPCRRMVPISPPPHLTLEQLRARVVCSECGARGGIRRVPMLSQGIHGR